jgi:hypothetical protein
MWIANLWVRSLPLVYACSIVVSAQVGPESPNSETNPRHTKTPSQVIAGTTVTGDIDRRTLQSALEVLPRRPERIVIIDIARMPRGRAAEMRDVDGFVLSGDHVIYLLRQSATLQAAEYSGGTNTLMLASVIWHEMAHTEGLDEPAARRREEELWREFVMSGRVSSSVGMAALAELRERRIADNTLLTVSPPSRRS